MEFRRLGRSGLTVSVVGLGTNNFGMKLDLEGCRAVLDAALDAGITLIDTADSYGAAETRLGELLAGRRDDVVLATKFGSNTHRPGAADNGADWGARGSRRYIRRAVESSLRRLRTDWIDLYQLHLPGPADADRGDALGADRPGARGQGPLPRPLELHRIPDRARGVDGAHGAPGTVRQRPERVQPDQHRRSSTSWCRPWSSTASGCCPTSRWPADCSPASTGAGSRRPRVPGSRPGTCRAS